MAATTVGNLHDSPDAVWSQGPVQLARGRQAKDPDAVVTTYSVSNIDEFEVSLREYLSNPPEQPEHAECHLSFWIGASFMVSRPQSSQPNQHPQHQSQVPAGYQPATGLDNHYGATNNASNPYQTSQHISNPAHALSLPYNSGKNKSNAGGQGSLSILEALAPTSDPKEKMRKQRAIAKACVDSIQRVDGYRYSFHNCWNSREDDSFRFSYYCNDSLLNKDRAANGKGAKLGKRATKPVYDCKGVLSVKFSATKQTLDVFYKHIPVHKTYEDRAPPPRKDSKRRKFLEEHDPDALIRIASKPRPARPPPAASSEEEDANRIKRKRSKRDGASQKQTAASSIESDLRAQSLRSLLELIQTDGPNPEAIQDQAQVEEQAQQFSRPSRSCDMCKAKKTKCDGARPVCRTCFEKHRQCVYPTAPEESPETVRAVSPPQIEPAMPPMEATHTMSELDKLRAELAEAKSRIGQLEAERTRTASESSTPSHPPPPPPQMTTPQYLNPHSYTPINHQPQAPVNRNMQTQSPVTHGIHGAPNGMGTGQDATDPYGRDFRWPPYFGYQAAATIHPPPQQHADQWTTARNPGVFR